MRQIILDTETTGLRIEDGHRLIEIGCLEMINRKLTGRKFHEYINPQREVEAGALAVHGISNDFLKNKPLFSDISAAFLQFIQDAELIIHNAPFDLSFLNHELNSCHPSHHSLTDICRVTDTLQLARQMHVGQRNSLDALCKRYGVDNTKRDFHGALLDAYLLSQVYLAMTGGQGSFFDSLHQETDSAYRSIEETLPLDLPIHLLPASEEELTAHYLYLDRLKEKGQCLWNKQEMIDDLKK
jgi:DNA polymerase III subunit epsilon